jgi:ATP-dependent Clp protease adaptor protein ClpS
MAISEKVKIKPSSQDSASNQSIHDKYLILYNDDVNTFEFVIESLIEICGHSQEQAEQCALITHFKGKCDVKKGRYLNLVPLKELLNYKGLSAVIE